MRLMRLIVCIFALSFGQLQAQEAATQSTPAAKAKKYQFSLDQLKTVDVLPGREAIQNPQAAELWHMKEKADKLNGVADTQEARDAIRRLTNKFTRQLQIAVNLPERRITNGKPADPGQIPYQVALVFAGYTNIRAGQFCGGSLINANWVLTAAHCLRANSRPGDIVIFADSVKLSQGGHLLSVAKVIRHSQYRPDTQQNDVALLKLSAPVQNPHVVGLADNSKEAAILANTSNATISGWGDTYYNSRLGSDDLLFATVPVVDVETCKKAYPNNKIFDGMVCAGEEGKDSCQGDSGGPMVIADGSNGNAPYQEGIVSWGSGCGSTYGVYTRVPAFVDWINQQMRSN